LAVIVIGGSGKDVGKTSLMCAVIAALREFAWTAVKIAGHDYEAAGSAASGQTVWEETRAGQETDTGRYLEAGARRALLVTRSGADVPIEEIWRAVGEERNVMFESNRIVDVVKLDVCLALMGNSTERKPSYLRLLRMADAVVSVGYEVDDVPEGVRSFRLESAGQLSGEMVEWLRGRVGAVG
jgi:hypothetical protein